MRSENLRIVEPCSADWEQMDGDGATRFCRLCKKDVHDLSSMTEADARAFLSAGDQPCIRYRHDARGDVVFTDRPGLLPRLAAAAALTLAGLASSGCLMGKRACPVTPEEQAAARAAQAEPTDAEPAPAPVAQPAPK